MHIAHFSNTYVPTISGVVRQIRALCNVHRGLGHRVSIFTQGARGFHEHDPDVHRYPTSPISMPMDFPVILPYSLEAERHLRTDAPEIIHVHHPFVLGQVGLSKAETLGLPVVFTFHTRYWEHSHFFPVNGPLVQQLVREVIHHRLRCFLKRCQTVVVYTNGMRDELLKRFDVRARIQVVPSGIDLAPFENIKGNGFRQSLGWEDKQVLIAVGRLSLEKNWLVLLDAVRLVMQTHPDFRMLMIGDGPQRNILETRAADYGISRRIRFLGRVGFDEIPACLKTADLFGFASTTETIGRVTMEAMAAGLPVVAVNAPGTQDLVRHGRDGLLTDNDSRALARGIQFLLDHEEARAGFGQAAQRRAGSFDVRIEAEKMLDVYYNTIDNYGVMGRKSKAG